MLLVLSPAKTLDFSSAPDGLATTRPQLTSDVKKLSAIARRLKSTDLRRLMEISESLADLNVSRFKTFDPKGTETDVPAALAFDGDVYHGLDARSLSPTALDWAQGHLRILSGLYGLLRPLDLIQPYRLEMGVRLQTDRGATLYDFWGDKLAKALNKAADGHQDKTLINLASQEYYGAVDARALKLPVVTCLFKERSNGESRVISFYAKRARGLMARFAIDNKIAHHQDLRRFDLEGYQFDSELSSDGQWTFSRPQPEPKAAARPHPQDAQL